MLNGKPGLVLLLLIVFAANYVETTVETSVHHLAAPISKEGYKGAYAVGQFEPKFIDFDYHDMAGRWAAKPCSISYFFLFPLLWLAVAVALFCREEIAPFRVFCLAIAIDYLASLPFFLFFPVPERWAYPESSAILLSDLWSSRLIQGLRPISGLDNCFPSSHVSLTVVIILVCWLFQVRLRTTVTALGLTVILSTFILGIHWLPDILAGLVVGSLAVALAVRFTDMTERWRLGWEALDQPVARYGRSGIGHVVDGAAWAEPSHGAPPLADPPQSSV